jgi:hypothetical protein
MYLQNLSPLSHVQKQFGFIELSFNEQIDFAIWILIESSTKFSPFDLHSVKTSLQKPLINPEQWHEWLTNLVAVFDPRWLCQVEDINREVESELSQYQSFIKNYSLNSTTIPELDWVAIRNNIEQRCAWKQLQYTQAIQEYGQQLKVGSSPIYYWKHNREIEIWLSKMWNLHQKKRYQNMNINQFMELTKNVSYPSLDTIKKIYLVNYPAFVQYQVSSTTTIIGISQSQEIEIQPFLQQLNFM